MNDVAVVALRSRAEFGFEGPVQGLVQLSTVSNTKIQRQAAIGLGALIHLDEAYNRLLELTIGRYTDLEVGTVAIRSVVQRGLALHKDLITEVFTKVLDGGNPKLHQTALILAQGLVAKQVGQFREMTSDDPEVQAKVAALQEALNAVQKDIVKERKILDIQKADNDEKEALKVQQKIVELHTEKKRLEDSMPQFDTLEQKIDLTRALFRSVLNSIGKDKLTRSEAYKTALSNNLFDENLDLVDKTATFIELFNIPDDEFLSSVCHDLWSEMESDQEWAWMLFRKFDQSNRRCTRNRWHRGRLSPINPMIQISAESVADWF